MKKTVAGIEYPPSAFLVVEDDQSPSTWHLQVRDADGKPDHRLMGAAWAALHGGYRGNKYQGPDKSGALDRLKALYESEEMPIPSEKSGRRNSEADQNLIDKILELVLMLGARAVEEDSENDDEMESSEMEYQGGAFTTFKGADGQTRWISVSSTAYQDRDGQIVSEKALDDDVYNRDDPDLGPLRWQHVGQPDFIAQKAGPGLDVGQCDFHTVYGRFLVESGTFKSGEIAEAISKGGPFEVSIGFFHPASQPDSSGVFEKIKRFERSLLPVGRASNLFTSFDTIGGVQMADKAKAVSDLRALLGNQLADQVVAQLEAKEKAADESGVSFKERIGNIFAALKGDPKPEPAQEAPAKAKTIADMTPEEFKALLQPSAPAEAEKAIKEDTLSAVKEAQAAQNGRIEATEKAIGEINVALKALLDELEALTGKPGYRPTQDETTVKAAPQADGTIKIDPAVSAWVNGGAK